MKFIVTEIQKFENGQMSTPSYAFDNRNAAEAKFHTILAGAAVSALPVHSCVMFTEEGVTLRSECFIHESTEEAVES